MGHAIACRYGCRDGGEGSCGGVGGGSAVHSHSMGGSRGRMEGHTHTQEHTHTEERTRECCTFLKRLSGPDPLRFLRVALRIEIPTRCIFCVAGRIFIGFLSLPNLVLKYHNFGPFVESSLSPVVGASHPSEH